MFDFTEPMAQDLLAVEQAAKGLRQRFDLNRIAQRRARAMGLRYSRWFSGAKPAIACAVAMTSVWPSTPRRGIADFVRAVVVDCKTLDDRGKSRRLPPVRRQAASAPQYRRLGPGTVPAAFCIETRGNVHPAKRSLLPEKDTPAFWGNVTDTAPASARSHS